MPEQVVWLPEFLRRNQSAREALAVLVSPGQVKEDGLLTPGQYEAHWEEKVERLMEAREQEQPGGVRRDLEVLGPPEVELYDLEGESLRHALGNHHNLKRGFRRLMVYLRNPNQENKDDLLSVYPQEGRALSHQQELQEQNRLQFLSLLVSL